MAKHFKSSHSPLSFENPGKAHRSCSKIPSTKLLILPLIPNFSTCLKLQKKRRYFVKKIQLSKLFDHKRSNSFRKLKQPYLTHFKILISQEHLNKDLWKHYKTIRKMELRIFSKEAYQVIRSLWKSMHLTPVRSLTIDYPHSSEPVALMKFLMFIRNLETLYYSRTYSIFNTMQLTPMKNHKRCADFWENHLTNTIRTLSVYFTFFSVKNFDSLCLKIKNLRVLELKSCNEAEDLLLIRSVPKLKELEGLEAVSLTLSECSTQWLMLNLFNELQNIPTLKHLTCYVPFCMSRRAPELTLNRFQELTTLQLAISQLHRSHNHSDVLDKRNFYSFFDEFQFPRLRKFSVILEKHPTLKPTEISEELNSFLTFLATLRPTLQHLVVRFYGPSFEHQEWERILETIGSLEHLENLEISDDIIYNNLCLGLVAKALAQLRKLKSLFLRYPTCTQKKFVNSFVQKVQSHPKLQSLTIVAMQFPPEKIKAFLRKLKEVLMIIKCGESEFEGLSKEFQERNGNLILSPVFYQCYRI